MLDAESISDPTTIHCLFSIPKLDTYNVASNASTVIGRKQRGRNQCNGSLHRSRNDAEVEGARAVFLPGAHEEDHKGEGTQGIVWVGQGKSINDSHDKEDQHEVDAVTS